MMLESVASHTFSVEQALGIDQVIGVRLVDQRFPDKPARPGAHEPAAGPLLGFRRPVWVVASLRARQAGQTGRPAVTGIRLAGAG